MPRTYLSSIQSAWPFPRQEQVLDQAAPDWRKGGIFRDALPPRKRKLHGPAGMEGRADLLRRTSRREGTTVHVASLAVLAWTPSDLQDVPAALAERGDTLISAEDGVTVQPKAAAAETNAAMRAFATAVRRVGDWGKSGGAVSGERRAGAPKAACETIRERWGMLSSEWTERALCPEAGVSRPTAIKYLGHRVDAQRAHTLRQATAERNRKRRKSDG